MFISAPRRVHFLSTSLAFSPLFSGRLDVRVCLAQIATADAQCLRNKGKKVQIDLLKGSTSSGTVLHRTICS